MPLKRAGDRHGTEVQKAIVGFFFRFVFFFFSFSFKICEIKKQIGQGGNACNMRQSLGQEERVEKGSG